MPCPSRCTLRPASNCGRGLGHGRPVVFMGTRCRTAFENTSGRRSKAVMPMPWSPAMLIVVICAVACRIRNRGLSAIAGAVVTDVESQ